tara:strand:+ start:519 stop:992 length:474 start_codon:yes stop_codon:yes gene_type:complete
MLNKIEQWIDKTNIYYKSQRACFSRFENEFSDFYPLEFLNDSFYVVFDRIPKPNFLELRAMGLSDFIDMDAAGITYKNTYYLLPHMLDNLRVHFHELVHVAQWAELGPLVFMQRYISEIQQCGYHNAPLELMAYGLDAHFTNAREGINIPKHVAKTL